MGTPVQSKLIRLAAMNRISQQEAVDRKMFGPVFHGTTEDRYQNIGDEGFKVYEGEARSEGVANGYLNQPYWDNIPPPIHTLGFGIYLTTNKNIAKQFAGGTTRGMKTYYLDVPRLETINFGVPKTMMKWWISQGYNADLAKKNRVEATKQMTEHLKAQFDAVWFKGKGMYRLLDGDQIAVFDPSRVYQVDPNLAKPGDVGSKVKRLADGMRGTIMGARSIPEDIAQQYWGGETRVYQVKWTKGGTDHNVRGSQIEFLGAPKAQGATASFKSCVACDCGGCIEHDGKTAAVKLPTWEEFLEGWEGIGNIVVSFEGYTNWDSFEDAERELKPRYERAAAHLKALKSPLRLYRTIWLPEGEFIENIRTNGVGIYWRTEEERDGQEYMKPEPHGGSGFAQVDYTPWHLQAEVSQQAVDWWGTLLARIHPGYGDEEYEIRLKKGATLKLTGYLESDEDNSWHPLQKTITASDIPDLWSERGLQAEAHNLAMSELAPGRYFMDLDSEQRTGVLQRTGEIKKELVVLREQPNWHRTYKQAREGFNDEGFWAGEGNKASGVLPICTTTGRICLAWRSPDVHIGDCWGTLGGAVKPEMSLSNSAKAELTEETGFTGGITMHPAYVFSSGSFSYHNFLGVVGTEFRFAPQSEHHWETTGLEWFTWDEIQQMVKEESSDFHPGLISLFKSDGKKIEQLLGKPKTASGDDGDMPNMLQVFPERPDVMETFRHMRPFERDRLVEEAQLEEIHPADLKTNQATLKRKDLQYFLDNPEEITKPHSNVGLSDTEQMYPLVCRTTEGDWLYDGNHRANAAMKLNMMLKCKVVDLRDYEEPRGKISRKLAARGEVGPVYHGTDKKFDKFEQKPGTRYILFSEIKVQAGGFFFTDDPEEAKEFGSNVMTCYLKMKKPLIRQEDQYNLSKKQIADLTYICEPCMSDSYSDLQGNSVKTIELGAFAIDVDPEGNWLNEIVKQNGLDWNILDNQEAVNRMKERGYDSTMVDEYNGKYSYCVFSADQIRIGGKARAMTAAEIAAPEKMFHRTDKDFDEFDPLIGGPQGEFGTHLAPNPKQLENFRVTPGAQSRPLKVNIKNPVRLEDYGTFRPDMVLAQLLNKKVITQAESDALLDPNTYEVEPKALRDLLMSKGYDGIVYLNRREGVRSEVADNSMMDDVSDAEFLKKWPEVAGNDSYIALKPDQIKSLFTASRTAATPARALKLYHVTTVPIAKDIKAHGFKPVDQGMWKNYYAPQGRDGIYFYDDLKYSEAYAAYTEGQLFTRNMRPENSWEENKKQIPQMAIIEVQVPEGVAITTNQKEDGFFVPTADLSKVKIVGMHKYDYIPTEGRKPGEKFGAAFPTFEQVMDESTLGMTNEFMFGPDEECKRWYDQALAFWKSQKFPLTIYRGMAVFEKDHKIDYSTFGWSWSLDKQFAQNFAENKYIDYPDEHHIEVFEGKITAFAVDWLNTFRAWVTIPEEKEVRLKPGAKVKIPLLGRVVTADSKPRSKYDKVCHAIATDDSLYGYFADYVQCSDAFEDRPADSSRVVELVKSLTPFVPPTTRKCLYRGESIRMGDDREPAKWEPHLRELLSWSLNYDTARYFAENRGIVWQTVGKIQGIALEDIVRWRNWTHPNESNYVGNQAEWFVLNTCKAREADWQKIGSQNPLLQKIADTDELRAYAQQVKSGSHAIQGIYLIGSTAEKGQGNDIDLLYDFGDVGLGDNPDETLESMIENTNMDLDSYDTFVKADGRYFHLSSGAGRIIVENTDYGMAQTGRPMIKLAAWRQEQLDKLIEGKTASDEFLYHGTNKKALAEILKAGFVDNISHWGSEAIARKWATDLYGRDGVLLAVSLNKFDPNALYKNENMIDMPLIGDYDELYDEWSDSGRTWRDCLRIYGAVEYDAKMPVTKANVLLLNAQPAQSYVTAASDGFLYHGTSHRAFSIIVNDCDGVMDTPSWWGTEVIANYYAEQEGEAAAGTDDEGFVILRVPMSRFNQSKLAVDNASVREPITTVLDDEETLQERWTASKKTWRDCLAIYESVVYNGPMRISEADVYEEVDRLYNTPKMGNTDIAKLPVGSKRKNPKLPYAV